MVPALCCGIPMRQAESDFDRFLRSLHRRLVAVRILERTGLGALAGCAAAAGLVVPLWWRGQPSIAPAAAAIALGAICGLIVGAARRPERFHAAAEADRQLGLADLLATALQVRGRPRQSDRDAVAQPWLATVIGMADARCRRHAPGEVVFRRLNGRAWGGIALAAALVLTISALTAEMPRAGAVAQRGVGQDRPREGRVGASKLTPHAAAATTMPQGPRDHPYARGSDASSAMPVDSDTGEKGRSPSSPAGAGRADGGSGAQGVGIGAGRSRPAARSSAPETRTAGRGRGLSAPTGSPAGGAGRATDAGTGAGSTTGTISGAHDAGRRVPPWRSDAWADDGRKAAEAVDSGAVPDAYRDLVRDYFDQP